MKQLPPPGDYRAKVNGRILIVWAKSKALCVKIPYIITQEGEGQGFAAEWLGVVFKGDGSPMQNTLDNLKEVFGPAGWDGVDLFWLRNSIPGTDTSAAREFPDVEFTLAQCVIEEYEGKPQFKAGFLNAGNGGMKMTEASSADVLAKFGSRLRALAGAAKPIAKPSTPATPPKPAAPATPPESPEQVEAARDNAWETCVKNHANDEAAAAKVWFATIEATGKEQSKFTIADWGKFKEKFADNVPA